MSETEHQATSILLPGAKVAVFSRDSETLASANSLKEDWRFARVDIDASEGDVETAINTFQNSPSPDLIIIQTDNIDDSLTERLGTLSGHCDEGTAAIVVGPVNDVYLYRQLIEMGVSDYLVRPILPEVSSEVIAKTLIERLGVSNSRLIGFIGSKGGVGTSVLAQLSAWLVTEKLGQKAMLMDAAGGWSPFSVGMSFDPSATLAEVSRAIEGNNEDSLKRMYHQVNDKLSILASGADAMLDPSVSAQQYESILDKLMVQHPVLLVDLSSAEASLRKTVISRAHHIIVNSTPTVTSLRFCRSLLKEISDVRGGDQDSVSLVVNKQGLSKANEVSIADISEALECKPSAVIPYLPSVLLKHESNVKALLSDKEFQPVITAFQSVLEKVVTGGAQAADGDVPDSGFLGGFINKLTSK